MDKQKNSTDVLESVKEVVSVLLGHMEVDAQAKLSIDEGEDGRKTVKVDVFGDDDLGRLIGRMGSSLRAIQTVIALLVNKGRAEPVYVLFDVNEYRAKREESLKQMAIRAADIAKKRARVYELPPMHPAERRVIHIALAEDDDVVTESAGEGVGRRVLIKPKGAPDGAPIKSEAGRSGGKLADDDYDEDDILDDIEMSEAKAEPEDIAA